MKSRAPPIASLSSTPTSFVRGGSELDSRASAGASLRHGLHQLAQKLTAAECSTKSGLFFFGEDLATIPQRLQTFASSGFEPIRYSIFPVIWCSPRNFFTVFGVSPFGSTETAMI